jgi:hypothetical protein
MQAQLEKIRSDAAECLLLSSLATDNKSSMFAKMAEHLNDLASELEKTLTPNSSAAVTGELIPFRSRSGREETGAAGMVSSVHHEDGAKADMAQRAARPRRLWPWLLIAVMGTIAGSSVWAGLHRDRLYQHLAVYLVPALERSKSQAAVGPHDGANALTALMATEQREREAIFKRLSALDVQVEGIARELDRLRHSQAPAIGQLVGPDDVTNAVDKPSDSTNRNSSASALRAACQRFRSYDAATGTYVTLDGRRLSCP